MPAEKNLLEKFIARSAGKRCCNVIFQQVTVDVEVIVIPGHWPSGKWPWRPESSGPALRGQGRARRLNEPRSIICCSQIFTGEKGRGCN